MKYILILCLCTIGCIENSSDNDTFSAAETPKPKIDASSYIDTTKQMMKELNIRIRDNIHLDSKLITELIDNRMGPDLALFSYEANFPMLNNDPETRIYKSPIIYITKEIDSTLYEKNDKSLLWEVHMKSVLIHELTHYLQKTFTPPPMKQITDIEHYSRPSEMEGSAVGSYYFLKQTNPKHLKQILSIKNRTEVFKCLIDEKFRANSAFMQSRGPIFNCSLPNK